MASSCIISVKTVRHKSFINCKQMMNPYSRRMKYGAVLRDPQPDPDVNFTVVMADAVGEHFAKKIRKEGVNNLRREPNPNVWRWRSLDGFNQSMTGVHLITRSG